MVAQFLWWCKKGRGVVKSSALNILLENLWTLNLSRYRGPCKEPSSSVWCAASSDSLVVIHLSNSLYPDPQGRWIPWRPILEVRKHFTTYVERVQTGSAAMSFNKVKAEITSESCGFLWLSPNQKAELCSLQPLTDFRVLYVFIVMITSNYPQLMKILINLDKALILLLSQRITLLTVRRNKSMYLTQIAIKWSYLYTYKAAHPTI